MPADHQIEFIKMHPSQQEILRRFMHLFNLSLDPRRDHRHLLEIQRDFARCCHSLRDRTYRDGIGFETLSDGVRRLKWPGMSAGRNHRCQTGAFPPETTPKKSLMC